jgi:dUTP pyrophosphatase
MSKPKPIKPSIHDMPSIYENNTVRVLFVKTHPDAILPVRNHGNIPLTEEQIAQFKAERDAVVEMRVRMGEPKVEIPLPFNDWAGTCDSGYDLFACEDTTILSQDRAIVPVGIKVGFITPGFWFRVESRSGLSFKNAILAHPGIIDNQYRGDMGVCLYNHSDKAYYVKKSDKIAQLVVYQLWDFKVGWVKEAVKTERGEKGFASSGR